MHCTILYLHLCQRRNVRFELLSPYHFYESEISIMWRIMARNGGDLTREFFSVSKMSTKRIWETEQRARKGVKKNVNNMQMRERMENEFKFLFSSILLNFMICMVMVCMSSEHRTSPLCFCWKLPQIRIHISNRC